MLRDSHGHGAGHRVSIIRLDQALGTKEGTDLAWGPHMALQGPIAGGCPLPPSQAVVPAPRCPGGAGGLEVREALFMFGSAKCSPGTTPAATGPNYSTLSPPHAASLGPNEAGTGHPKPAADPQLPSAPQLQEGLDPIDPPCQHRPRPMAAPNPAVMGIPNVSPGHGKWGPTPGEPQASSMRPGAAQPLERGPRSPFPAPFPPVPGRSWTGPGASWNPAPRSSPAENAAAGPGPNPSHEEPPAQAGGGPRERTDARTHGPEPSQGWQQRGWGRPRLPEPLSAHGPQQSAPRTPQQSRQHWHKTPRGPLPKPPASPELAGAAAHIPQPHPNGLQAHHGARPPPWHPGRGSGRGALGTTLCRGEPGGPRCSGSLLGRAGSARGAAVRSKPAVSSLLSALGPGRPHTRGQGPAAPQPPPAPGSSGAVQGVRGGPLAGPHKRDPHPVSPKHLSRESPSRFSRPRAGVNHAPARLQGRSQRHTLGTDCVCQSWGCHSRAQGDVGLVWTPGTAWAALMPLRHGTRWTSINPHPDTATQRWGRSPCQHPTGAPRREPSPRGSSPLTPPRPAAGWEPQTEIPPVVARPALVTPGTRCSGYTSRTRHHAPHSSAGTGAPAPATAPGTAVPRCHRHHLCTVGAASPKDQPCPPPPAPGTAGTPTHAHSGDTPGSSSTPILRMSAGNPKSRSRGVTVPGCPIPAPHGLLLGSSRIAAARGSPRLFLALDAARSRRPGNGVPGTARPQTALSGSATAGRQVQPAAPAAWGRSGHGTRGWRGTAQRAGGSVNTPGQRDLVAPGPWLRQAPGPGHAGMGPGIPGGEPNRHRVAPRLATQGHADVCHHRVLWHRLADPRYLRRRQPAPPARPPPASPPRQRPVSRGERWLPPPAGQETAQTPLPPPRTPAPGAPRAPGPAHPPGPAVCAPASPPRHPEKGKRPRLPPAAGGGGGERGCAHR
ncbi:basic proline-rich protein-like [Pezoporus flaviventris]|uniref:basic proline-rich protein-like n=1 Tax=Pezoporus flaviventris TaxID=889875 RepID=UPI002AB21AFB|nr:basic proline-rich protein-like [Pezoporus flaviventris]